MPAAVGSDELLNLFARIREVLVPFEKDDLVAYNKGSGKYELNSRKPGVFIHGKIRDEASFIALLVKSNYIGFYFMPVYTNPEIKPLIPAQMLKLLKGKSCFHIKKWDDDLAAALSATMETGLQTYRNNGWL